MTGVAHVIVADDDPRKSGVLSWVLRERGYAVSAVPVHGGDELIEVLRTRPADLILLGANGHVAALDETLRKVRLDEQYGDVPVIIAGVTDAQDAANVLRKGADDWLPKPLRVADLLARVAALLSARAEMRSVRLRLLRREEELQRASQRIER